VREVSGFGEEVLKGRGVEDGLGEIFELGDGGAVEASRRDGIG
jgi:hypothetical protein